VEKSERILALQKLGKILPEILSHECQYKQSRKIEKELAEKEIEAKKCDYDDPNLDLDTQRQNFYKSSSRHTPGDDKIFSIHSFFPNVVFTNTIS